MNLYLLTQNKVEGYDTYDAAVVAAKNEADARLIHPDSDVVGERNGLWMEADRWGNEGLSIYTSEGASWPAYEDIDCIDVKYLGKTIEDRGAILASYNAG